MEKKNEKIKTNNWNRRLKNLIIMLSSYWLCKTVPWYNWDLKNKKSDMTVLSPEPVYSNCAKRNTSHQFEFTTATKDK
jgi:hypothetical protein